MEEKGGLGQSVKEPLATVSLENEYLLLSGGTPKRKRGSLVKAKCVLC